eukprot:6209426-Pleurochrysis_carterae.AAC.1
MILSCQSQPPPAVSLSPSPKTCIRNPTYGIHPQLMTISSSCTPPLSCLPQSPTDSMPVHFLTNGAASVFGCALGVACIGRAERRSRGDWARAALEARGEG